MSRLERDTVNETYEDLKNFVYQIAHRFAYSYNVPFEELRSVADYYYVKAVKHYKPSRKAKLITWVGFVVTKQMQTYLEKEHPHRYWFELDESNGGHCNPSNFLMEVKGLLGPDAALVVELIVDSNSHMQQMLRRRAKKSRTVTRHMVLRVLTEHLRDIGWERDRIEGTMEEIRWVLTKL